MSAHLNSSTRCGSTGILSRKRWQGSIAEVNKRRRLTGTRRRILKKVSESESSEVGSDEECQFLSDAEDVPLDINGFEVDRELWKDLVDEDRSIAESMEETTPLEIARGDIFVEEYPGAAEIKSRGLHLYAQIMETDEFQESWRFFSQQANFEEYAFLNEARIPMAKIDEYCKLSFVNLSFLRYDDILSFP